MRETNVLSHSIEETFGESLMIGKLSVTNRKEWRSGPWPQVLKNIK